MRFEMGYMLVYILGLLTLFVKVETFIFPFIGGIIAIVIGLIERILFGDDE